MPLLNLREKPATIQVSLKGSGDVRIVGIDADAPETVYIDRNRHVSGTTVLRIPLPLAPSKLAVACVSDEKVSMRLKILPLRLQPISLEPEMWSFLDFVANISKYASYLPESYLSDAQEENFALFADALYKHDTGEPSYSPARVSKKTGDMELNRLKLQSYTVPMRFFIMLHERAHYELYTSNEFKCDTWASRLYLQLGFSPLEAVYAMTKVFQDNERNVARVKNSLKILKSEIEK